MALVCNVVRAGRHEVKLARIVVNLILIAGLISAKQVLAANIPGNPGFETGNFTNGTTFGSDNDALSGASQAHSGNYYYKVCGQFNGATNYTAIYQDNLSAPGNTYTADGRVFSRGSDGDGIHGQDAIWLEISFRDASDNALALYRSAIVNPGQLRRDEYPVRFADHQPVLVHEGVRTDTVAQDR
jgi:hypothetical protein